VTLLKSFFQKGDASPFDRVSSERTAVNAAADDDNVVEVTTDRSGQYPDVSAYSGSAMFAWLCAFVPVSGPVGTAAAATDRR
jgi:hypothetical protein